MSNFLANICVCQVYIERSLGLLRHHLIVYPNVGYRDILNSQIFLNYSVEKLSFCFQINQSSLDKHMRL